MVPLSSARRLPFSRLSLCIVFVHFAFAQLVFADNRRPCVQFDVAQTIAAVDVSTPEFLHTHPSEKLIRVRLPISSLVRLGREDSLLQYLYVVSGTGSTVFQVVDYAPRTTLGSDVSGDISIEESSGSSGNFGLKALAPLSFPVKADATAAINTSSSEAKRMSKLPPLELVAASGTLQRGTAVYFKLKPTTQTTLEGDKAFEIVARVPYNWRAGLLQVNCAAFAKVRGPSTNENLVCGQNRFVVGAYSAGDEVAKQMVRKLSETQYQLKQLAITHAGEIADERFPSIGHKLGAALSLVKPRIPDRWLDQLLLSNDFRGFEKHLPRSIRMAATEYREARKQVIGFAG